MTKKVKDLVKVYYEILGLHVKDEFTNKSNVIMMYKAKFSCLEDLKLLTPEEYIECCKRCDDIVYGEGGEK